MKKIVCSGIVGWDITPAGIREALRDANGDDVEFEFSSPGGFIAPGLEIFNMIRQYPGHTTARLTGYAMSMASYIPLACDKIVALDNAVYMIHNARGGVWDDHNGVLGYGAFLKGLSGVIAKQYVKRTGKSLDDVTAMMDKETYFFGDEMVEHGFVDEIEATDEDKDSGIALATAKAVFGDAVARMSAEAMQIREDMQQAAAALNINLQVVAQPPAAAGTLKQEVQQMSLAKLLADNPAAKAEHDAAIAAAKAEGEKAGKEATMAMVKQVTPILSSTEYPAKVKETAIKVLEGTETATSLTTIVAVADMLKEQTAQAAAQTATETAGETPAAPVPAATGEVAVITDDTGLEALINKTRGE